MCRLISEYTNWIFKLTVNTINQIAWTKLKEEIKHYLHLWQTLHIGSPERYFIYYSIHRDHAYGKVPTVHDRTVRFNLFLTTILTIHSYNFSKSQTVTYQSANMAPKSPAVHDRTAQTFIALSQFTLIYFNLLSCTFTVHNTLSKLGHYSWGIAQVRVYINHVTY
jgi:hypothetical protein